ncbi:unnamed protein product [Paramecium sonneborni]|uniref:SPRY domain-containing protein n=1 Tax=Paramecium sonneborni TaxID=65129 RepID=A0A8S1RQT8_9CILI|nr:unnamed protein product [Paramecium sonneborni]
MNDLACQMPEVREMICKTHKRELVAIDLVSSESRKFEFLCLDCLVEKINNNNISTFESTKIRIQQYKNKRLEKRTKDIEIRQKNFEILLHSINELKNKIEEALVNIYSEIKKQMSEGKQSLEEFQTQLNFLEDVKQLSEFLSIQENEKEFQQDGQFIDGIFQKFEQIFKIEHNKTIQTFKDVLWNINNFNRDIKIEIMQTQNNQKTSSLSSLCLKHNKEIIMIDIDSKSKQIEDRFACAKCLSDHFNNINDHPQCQYKTIEEVNQIWNDKMKEQDQIVDDLMSKRNVKKVKLQEKIAKMNQGYMEQLNDISETVRKNLTSQTREINKFKYDSIQQLSKEDLLSNIQILIHQNQKQQNEYIEQMMIKELQNSKIIASKFEQLKWLDQLDIQQSINILQDKPYNNQIQGILKPLQQINESKSANQEQLITEQEFQEFIISSQQIYCQLDLFNQTIKQFQDHLLKIDSINDKLKKNQDHQNFTNIYKQFCDYMDKFEKDCFKFQKFLQMDQLENELETLREKLRLNIELKEKEQKEMKELHEQAIQDFKKQYQQMMKKFEDEQKEIKQKFNQNLTQKQLQLQQARTKLDQIEQIQLESEKQKKIELEEIRLFNKSLQFSNTYKHSSCQVSECGKLVAEVNNSGWYYCLCEQSIPKTGKILFAFQILDGSYFHVGIGFREIMQKNNYINCYHPGCGTYVINNYGILFSHSNKDVDNKQLCFLFTNNDIIIIEVCIEHKYIKWRKSNNPYLTFVVDDIDTSQELYPCVSVYGKSRIRLLDSIPI